MKLEPPQVEFAKQANQFQNTFWENHDLTEQPVITSVYCVRKLCIRGTVYVIFQNRLVMDQKPN